jgi:prolyl-tRNA synthetase
MIWPENVAPYRFHLLELKKELGKKIYQRLLADGIEVLYDNRGVSAGEKFADADLIGLPYRLVVSEKTGSLIELKRRASETKKMMKYEDIRRI